LLLALAEVDLYESRWSDQILEETKRTLINKMGLSAEKAAKRIAAMRSTFPEACVAGFQQIEPTLDCHTKDRHVLAAAIAAGASIIVTGNLKDFPPECCAPYGVEAVHPDGFLCRLLGEDPGRCREAVEAEAARHLDPPMTATDLLVGLTRIAPNFANLVNQVM